MSCTCLITKPTTKIDDELSDSLLSTVPESKVPGLSQAQLDSLEKDPVFQRFEKWFSRQAFPTGESMTNQPREGQRVENTPEAADVLYRPADITEEGTTHFPFGTELDRLCVRIRTLALEGLKSGQAFDGVRKTVLVEYGPCLREKDIPTSVALGRDPFIHLNERVSNLNFRRGSLETMRDEILKERCTEAAVMIDRLARVLYVVYGMFVKDIKWNELLPVLVKYFFLELGCLAARNLKFHTNWIFTNFFGQESPSRGEGVVDKDGYLVGGRLRKEQTRVLGRTRNLKKLKCPKRLCIAATFLRIKQGLPKLSVYETADDLFDHAKTLSSPPSSPEVDPELLRHVSELVQSVFKGHIFEPTQEMAMSSSSSTLVSTRATGGFRGFVASECEEIIAATPVISLGISVRRDGETTLSRFGFEPDVVDVNLFVDYLQETLLDEHNLLYQQELRRIRMGYTHHNEVAVVQEPLKTRPVTRASGKAYFILKPLQLFLHKIMRNYPLFRLIGRPMTLSDLEDSIGPDYLNWESVFNADSDWNLDDRSRPGEELRTILGKVVFNSGDFKGATDRLHLGVTEHVAREMLKTVGVAEGSALFRLAMDSLSPGTVGYETALAYTGKPYSPRVPDDIKQQNGQLMGSILSFLVLCIANAAVYRHALHTYIQKVTPVISTCFPHASVLRLPKDRELPCLINGDDIAFAGPTSLMSQWEASIGLAGFIKSVGKNFFSDHFLTINSRYYTFDTDRFIEAGYVNLGLIFDEGKSVKTDDRDDLGQPLVLTCGRMVTDLLKSIPQKFHDQMVSWFIFYHPELKEQAPGLNYFIPTHLGGLGLPCTREVRVTEGQRKLATYLKAHPCVTPPLYKIYSTNAGKQFHRVERCVCERRCTCGRVVPEGRVLDSEEWNRYHRVVNANAKAWSVREQIMEPPTCLRDDKRKSFELRQLVKRYQSTSLKMMNASKMLGYVPPLVWADWEAAIMPVLVTL